MTEKNKEFLRMVERLMIRHLPITVSYGGKIKQITVYFKGDVTVEIKEDSELVYGL